MFDEPYSTNILFMEANSVGFLEFCSTRQQWSIALVCAFNKRVNLIALKKHRKFLEIQYIPNFLSLASRI